MFLKYIITFLLIASLLSLPAIVFNIKHRMNNNDYTSNFNNALAATTLGSFGYNKMQCDFIKLNFNYNASHYTDIY